MHVVLVDDEGRVTGIKGNIIEKHLNLSKANDTVSAVNPPDKTYYKDYIALYSKDIYAGINPSNAKDDQWGTNPRASGFSTACTAVTTGDGLWGQDAQGITYLSLIHI